MSIKNFLIPTVLFVFGCSNGINNPDRKETPTEITFKTGITSYQLEVTNSNDTNLLQKQECSFDTSIYFQFTTPDLKLIKEKALEIGLKNYPDTFHIKNNGTTWSTSLPSTISYFNIKTTELNKSVYWDDCDYINNKNDSSAIKLKSFFNFVDTLINKYPEVQKLPQIPCMYL